MFPYWYTVIITRLVEIANWETRPPGVVFPHGKCPIGRLLRPDIVHFRSACHGTEIFLQELALLNTLSSNPKSSRSVGLAFSHQLLFYFL